MCILMSTCLRKPQAPQNRRQAWTTRRRAKVSNSIISKIHRFNWNITITFQRKKFTIINQTILMRRVKTQLHHLHHHRLTTSRTQVHRSQIRKSQTTINRSRMIFTVIEQWIIIKLSTQHKIRPQTLSIIFKQSSQILS